MSFTATLLLLLACFTLHSTTAIRFYLDSGQKRCFTEELPSNTKITGETRITGGRGNAEVDVWISTVRGKLLYHRRAPEHGKFSFHTPLIHDYHEDVDIDDDYEYGDEHNEDDEEEDTYKVCIENFHHGGSSSADGRRSVFFRLHESFGDVVESSDRAARASDTDRLQSTMRSMHTTLSGMIGDLSQLQRRERTLTNRMKRTASRVTYLAVFSLIITLGTSALQYWYYKGYFKQKKLC